MHYAFYGQWKIAAYYRDSRKQLPHFFHLLAELHRKNIRMIFISRVCISFSRIHWEHGSCKHIIIYAFHFFMLSFYYLPTKGRYLNSGNHFTILNIDNIKSRFGTLMTFLNSFFARERSQTSHNIARKCIKIIFIGQAWLRNASWIVTEIKICSINIKENHKKSNHIWTVLVTSGRRFYTISYSCFSISSLFFF